MPIWAQPLNPLNSMAISALAAIVPLAALHAQNPQLPPDVDATIRAANAQRNHEMQERAARAELVGCGRGE